MDYLKMLFVAEVSKICMDIALQDNSAYDESIKDEPNRDALMEKWLAEHPASSHVPRALRHLKKIADEIDRVESEFV